MSDTPLIYDWNGVPAPASGYAPVTNRPAAALYNPQGGIVSLGSDYGTTPKAQVPKVDAYGSQYVVPSNPAGAAAQVYTAQAAPTAASQFGNLCMTRQDLPAPSTYYPLNSDMQMSLNIHHRAKPTFRAVTTGVACAANKSLVSLTNASTGSLILRLDECFIYVPPSGLGGSLLGSAAATYYPLICQLYRITASAMSGGTSMTAVSSDSADTLTSAATISTGATIASTVATYHRADAIAQMNGGLAWFARTDQNEKTFVIRPGEGFSVTCISNGQINNSSATGQTTALVDIEMVLTQATA